MRMIQGNRYSAWSTPHERLSVELAAQVTPVRVAHLEGQFVMLMSVE